MILWFLILHRRCSTPMFPKERWKAWITMIKLHNNRYRVHVKPMSCSNFGVNFLLIQVFINIPPSSFDIVFPRNLKFSTPTGGEHWKRWNDRTGPRGHHQEKAIQNEEGCSWSEERKKTREEKRERRKEEGQGREEKIEGTEEKGEEWSSAQETWKET